MKVTILDDYYDTLQTLPCFARLDDHKVTIWNDHVQDVDVLAERPLFLWISLVARPLPAQWA